MSQNDWKDWYRESIREWKKGYKNQLKEWKEKFKDWKHQAKEDLAEGSVPPMPPMPQVFPMPTPMPQIHFTGARSNVVASRIGDKELKTVDMLIEAGLFETRSEAVAYMVSEGIKTRKDVVNKVTSALEEIRKLRREANEQITNLRKEIGITEEAEAEEAEPKGRFCTKCGKSLQELPEDISVCPYCGTKLTQD
jgi:hypothetical protein